MDKDNYKKMPHAVIKPLKINKKNSYLFKFFFLMENL